MKGRLKVTVSVGGDRRIFVDMEVVLAGVVVVEGGGRVGNAHLTISKIQKCGN